MARRTRNIGEVTGDVVAALAFNLALFGSAVGGARLYQTVQDANVYGYDQTSAARAHAISTLQREARSRLPVGLAPTDAWVRQVELEHAEGDAAAVRALLIAAPGLIGSADAARILRQAPPNAPPPAIAEAALAILPPDLAVRVADDARGVGIAAVGGFSLLGDGGEIAARAEAWAAGRPGSDEADLMLAGAAMALAQGLPPGDPAARAIETGASVARAARRSQLLSPTMRAELEAASLAAIDAEILRSRLPDNAEPKATLAAFQAALDPDRGSRLAEILGELGALADLAGSNGAIALAQQANDLGDIARLRLVAWAAPDLAVFVAKRGARGDVLSAAQGTVRFSDRLWIDLAVLALTLAAAVALAVWRVRRPRAATRPLRRGRNRQPTDVAGAV